MIRRFTVNLIHIQIKFQSLTMDKRPTIEIKFVEKLS